VGWRGGDPWFGGFWLLGSFYVVVSHARGALPPLGEGAFSIWFQFILALAELEFRFNFVFLNKK
jgi:hypothetical protein